MGWRAVTLNPSGPDNSMAGGQGAAQAGTYQPAGAYPPPPGNYPPGAPVPPPVYQPPVVRGSNKRNLLIRLAIIVVVVIVLAVGGVIWKHLTGDPTTAKVGSCVKQSGTDNVKVVDCSSSDAAYIVLGKVDQSSKPSDDQMQTACNPWSKTEAAFWDSDNGGFILCLGATS